MRAPRHARPHPLLALALAPLALVACGGVEPMPADRAVAHYDEVGAAVAASLGDLGGPWEHRESSRAVRAEDDGCTYSAGTWDAASPLDGVRGEEGWGRVTEAAQPAADDAGFGEFGPPERSGARAYVEATDAHGATLRIDDQSGIAVLHAHVDAEPCTAGTLGLG